MANFARALLTTCIATYVQCAQPLLRYLYLSLPSPIGFGGVADAGAVCAELTRNNDAAFWRGSAVAETECERLIAARVTSLHLAGLLVMCGVMCMYTLRRWACAADTSARATAFLAAMKELSPWRQGTRQRVPELEASAYEYRAPAHPQLRKSEHSCGYVDLSPHPERVAAAFSCAPCEADSAQRWTRAREGGRSKSRRTHTLARIVQQAEPFAECG